MYEKKDTKARRLEFLALARVKGQWTCPLGADGGDHTLFLFCQLFSSLYLKRLKVFQETVEALFTLLNSGFDRSSYLQSVLPLIFGMLAPPRFIINLVPFCICLMVTVSRMTIEFIQSLAERLTFLASTSILPTSDGPIRLEKTAGRRSTLADPLMAMRY